MARAAQEAAESIRRAFAEIIKGFEDRVGISAEAAAWEIAKVFEELEVAMGQAEEAVDDLKEQFNERRAILSKRRAEWRERREIIEQRFMVKIQRLKRLRLARKVYKPP